MTTNILFVMNTPDTQPLSDEVLAEIVRVCRVYRFDTVLLHIPLWQQYRNDDLTRIVARDDCMRVLDVFTRQRLRTMLHLRPMSRPDGRPVETMDEAYWQMREYTAVINALVGVRGIYLDGLETLHERGVSIYDAGDAIGWALSPNRDAPWMECVQGSQSRVGRLAHSITRMGQRDYWVDHGMDNPIAHCRTFDAEAIRRWGRHADLGWFSKRILYQEKADGPVKTRPTTDPEWRAFARAVLRNRCGFTLQWFGPGDEDAWGDAGRTYLRMLKKE